MERLHHPDQRRFFLSFLLAALPLFRWLPLVSSCDWWVCRWCTWWVEFAGRRRRFVPEASLSLSSLSIRNVSLAVSPDLGPVPFSSDNGSLLLGKKMAAPMQITWKIAPMTRPTCTISSVMADQSKANILALLLCLLGNALVAHQWWGYRGKQSDRLTGVSSEAFTEGWPDWPVSCSQPNPKRHLSLHGISKLNHLFPSEISNLDSFHWHISFSAVISLFKAQFSVY